MFRSAGGWKLLKFGRLDVVAEEEKRRRKVDGGKSMSESLKSETGERGQSQVPKPEGGGAAAEADVSWLLSMGAWRSRWKENMASCECAAR